MNIAINGLGRIGRNFLRAILLDPSAARKIKIVTINVGPASLENIGLLCKYDTLLGHYPGSVKQKETTLIIDGHEIELLAEAQVQNINWAARNIDWVVDCSGKYTKRAMAQQHIQAGAKKVLISAPATDEDVAIIPGVNDQAYSSDKHHIVSLGSCTTNALMPMLKILHEQCGLQYAFMQTVHAYTNSQPLLDGIEKDPRRARAGALNIVPTSTGATKMVAKIIPALENKIFSTALRVPVGVVSLLTITFTSNRALTVAHINKSFEEAAAVSLKGIIDITHEPLVSSDFARTTYSVIVDSLLTNAFDGMATVTGWYDNEWAYSLRMKDFLLSTI